MPRFSQWVASAVMALCMLMLLESTPLVEAASSNSTNATISCVMFCGASGLQQQASFVLVLTAILVAAFNLA